MDVLSIVHGGDAGSELFAPLVTEAGHRLDEWSFATATPPPRPLDAYDAVLVFGGAMHVDQEEQHPWLRDETDWLRALLEHPVPTLGICLGSQLLAQAAGARVGPLAEPEIGWSEVELTDAGAADTVLSALPPRFVALQWHHYAHELPDGAVALAHSTASLQGFRLGDACWGVQFHPEVTEPQLERWIDAKADLPDAPDRLRAETRERIGGWNELGRRLCRSFLAAAERLRTG
ncbi:MAG TPA: type 1 glutamine amidotransferase [Gaiellaceae bacterium]|nr:type 1 glutamine amidotransferase [Gaiellaceae bacterium]